MALDTKELELLERKVREVLATETRAANLNQRLFDQKTGLFSNVAKTREEREQIANTTVFREAHARYSALRQAEAEDFARNLKKSETPVS